MPDRIPLTEEKANKIYDILVEAGANENMRIDFIYHFMQPDPPKEWRFQGKLGFGGKFRYGTFAAPLYRVDCYEEDETPERLELIEVMNEKLEKLIEVTIPWKAVTRGTTLIFKVGDDYFDGEVLDKTATHLSVVYLDGYKSRNEDLTKEEVLGVVDRSCTIPESKIGPYKGHFYKLR